MQRQQLFTLTALQTDWLTDWLTVGLTYRGGKGGGVWSNWLSDWQTIFIFQLIFHEVKPTTASTSCLLQVSTSNVNNDHSFGLAMTHVEHKVQRKWRVTRAGRRRKQRAPGMGFVRQSGREGRQSIWAPLGWQVELICHLLFAYVLQTHTHAHVEHIQIHLCTYITLVFLVSFCLHMFSKIIALFGSDLCHSVFRLFCVCSLDSHADRCVSVRMISSLSTTNMSDKLIMLDSVDIAVLQSNFIRNYALIFWGNSMIDFPWSALVTGLSCLVLPRNWSTSERNDFKFLTSYASLRIWATFTSSRPLQVAIQIQSKQSVKWKLHKQQQTNKQTYTHTGTETHTQAHTDLHGRK